MDLKVRLISSKIPLSSAVKTKLWRKNRKKTLLMGRREINIILRDFSSIIRRLTSILALSMKWKRTYKRNIIVLLITVELKNQRKPNTLNLFALWVSIIPSAHRSSMCILRCRKILTKKSQQNFCVCFHNWLCRMGLM